MCLFVCLLVCFFSQEWWRRTRTWWRGYRALRAATIETVGGGLEAVVEVAAAVVMAVKAVGAAGAVRAEKAVKGGSEGGDGGGE